MSTILVAGSGGFFGRRLIADLLAHSDARVLAGGRGRTDLAALHSVLPRAHWERVTPCLCDLERPDEVERALESAQAAVCAAGPAQTLPTTLLEACLRRNVPYLDLSDDRAFVRRARALAAARQGAPPIGAGWSAAPALSALLARWACGELEQVERVDVQIAPGNRGGRGRATVYSLLDSMAKPFEVGAGGSHRQVLGWSEPKVFAFPPPVGSREGFLVDAPDHELLPPLFGGARVEFRAGAELAGLNRAASILAWFSNFYGVRWVPAAGIFSALLRAGSLLGTDTGALGVAATGRAAGRRLRRTLCLIAERRGEEIPLLPAAILAPRLAAGAASWTGLIPLDSWIARADFEAECAKRGFRLVAAEEPA